MQIDFHHAVTYVTARIAGFSHDEADIIAYSAQYVDDATSSGTISFKNGAQYHRISSAHQMLDLKNLKDEDNREVWLPFHFLPGNGTTGFEKDFSGKFINKLICLPDSPIAKDMIEAALADKNKPYALHRLGITMHVYADTWAHQQFAGVDHEVNDVEDPESCSNTGEFEDLKNFLEDVLDEAIPPLGHARADVFPDMPFLTWRYINGRGQTVSRNNCEEFCMAADKMCIAMKRYLAGDPVGLDENNKAKMKELFLKFTQKDGDERHKLWLEEIRIGTFTDSAGKPITEILTYNEKGRNSWKAAALGTSLDLDEYEFKDSFLKSNWKMFHDALQQHRLTVLHEILPNYGICAA